MFFEWTFIHTAHMQIFTEVLMGKLIVCTCTWQYFKLQFSLLSVFYFSFL